MKKNEEKDNTIIILIGLILLIGAVYLLFDYKPKTERYQEVLKELEAQKE